MVKSISFKTKQEGERAIPDELVRDVIDGEAFYYKGYRDVLNKTKTIEELMGCSTLQGEIIMYLNYLLTQALGIIDFRIYTGEIGIHLSKKINYGLDLVVFDSHVLSSGKIDSHYANVPPHLVVEVDVRVDTQQLTEEEFIEKKTKSLLKHGAGKVVWVSTKSKKILIAEPGRAWQEQNWHEPFELLSGIRANVGEYLKMKGIPAGLDDAVE